MLTHPYGRAPTGPLLSLLVEHLKVLNSRACLRILSLSLSLSVEHLKVMAALTVEPAYASLWSSPSGPLPYGRACLRIQFTYWAGVLITGTLTKVLLVQLLLSMMLLSQLVLRLAQLMNLLMNLHLGLELGMLL